jgi:hypothetical protein
LTEVVLEEPDWLMSLVILVDSLIVGGREGIEGIIVLVAPVGKLLTIVVAAVIVARATLSWFGFVECVVDVLNSVLEGLIISVLIKVNIPNPPTGLRPRD